MTSRPEEARTEAEPDGTPADEPDGTPAYEPAELSELRPPIDEDVAGSVNAALPDADDE